MKSLSASRDNGVYSLKLLAKEGSFVRLLKLELLPTVFKTDFSNLDKRISPTTVATLFTTVPPMPELPSMPFDFLLVPQLRMLAAENDKSKR